MSTLSLSTFDTLAYVKRLKEADVPEKQAEAQAEALRAALSATLDEHASALATKGDVALVRKDMDLIRKDMEALENRLLLKLGAMLLAGFASVIALLVRLLG